MIDGKGYLQGVDPYSTLVKTQTVTKADIEPYMEDLPVAGNVLDMGELRDDLDDFFTTQTELLGAKMPWPSTHEKIRFRGGETTLWAGVNGHGKSLMVGLMCLAFAAQNEKFLMISLEMKPRDVLGRMCKQATGVENPSKKARDEFCYFLLNQGFMYAHQGSMSEKFVYACVRYAASAGIKHVVVDNIQKCVKGVDNYNAQKDFVNDITQLAQQLNVHCHVVHHIRKQQSEHELPNKFDLTGSGSMADLVDQIVIVYKNKKKFAMLESTKEKDVEMAKEMPDAILAVEKNRHGDWEGRIRLWFDRRNGQYRENKRLYQIEPTKPATYTYSLPEQTDNWEVFS